LADAAAAVYAGALERAVIETRLDAAAFPATLPYCLEQIFERDLPAEGLPEPRSTRKKNR
jgi:hypothetical protein